MATRLEKITSIKVFPNDEGAAKWGNSKFSPYKDGSPADITLRGDKKYRVSVFENEDGTLGISITEPIQQQAGDNLHDNVQQGGLRKVAETSAVKRNALSLDDDIPF
jgi:hypothetical protein